MLSPKLFQLYLQTVRLSNILHCVPYTFDEKTGILEKRQGWHLRIVYANNALSLLFSLFLISQYIMGRRVMEENRTQMTSLLTMVLACNLLMNTFTLQNIFVLENSLEFWNSTFDYFTQFRGTQLSIPPICS